MPTLQVRVGASEQALGPFHPALAPIPISMGDLFLNARGNLRLAYYGLFEQLTSDLSELDDGDSRSASELVSYALLVELARACAREQAAPDARVFQFQLTSSATGESDPLVLSLVHPL